MTLHEIIRTTVKMTGLVLIIVGLVRASSSLPFWVSSFLGDDGSTIYLVRWIAMVSPPILIGVFLWLFPRPVTNRIIAKSLPDSNRAEWLRGLEAIGIRLLGIYLLFLAIFNLIVRGGNFLYIRNAVGGDYAPSSVFEFKLGLFVDALQLFVALALVLGASGLVGLVHRLRYGGRHELARNETRESG